MAICQRIACENDFGPRRPDRPPIQWVVIELADAGVFQIVAIGGWDANADMTGDNCSTSLNTLMILQTAAGAITL